MLSLQNLWQEKSSIPNGKVIHILNNGIRSVILEGKALINGYKHSVLEWHKRYRPAQYILRGESKNGLSASLLIYT